MKLIKAHKAKSLIPCCVLNHYRARAIESNKDWSITRVTHLEHKAIIQEAVAANENTVVRFHRIVGNSAFHNDEMSRKAKCLIVSSDSAIFAIQSSTGCEALTLENGQIIEFDDYLWHGVLNKPQAAFECFTID